MTPLFAFNLGPQEIAILLILGVLLFGRKLPEVGKSLGKALKEFQHGWRGLEDELDTTVHRPSITTQEPPRLPQRVAPETPKFEAQ